jgi:hypothetical protein
MKGRIIVSLLVLLCGYASMSAQKPGKALPAITVEDSLKQASAIDSAKYLWPKGLAKVSLPGGELRIPAGKEWTNIKLSNTPVFLAASTFGDSLMLPRMKQFANPFKPDPQRAVWYSLVPGLGQIYNRKYWKLPIVYGGLMACYYAVTWNNKNYRDYYNAYFDIMYDSEHSVSEENYGSWVNYVPAGTTVSSYLNNTSFQSALKRKKDYFRRYRDLSIMITVGVYAISIIDAYVDAQLFDFDITPELSMHWAPEVMPKSRYQPMSYGLNCSFVF